MMPKLLRQYSHLGLLSLWLVLPGCINVRSDRIAQSTFDRTPVTDRPDYNLSETTFVVAASVTLNDCNSVVAHAMLAPGQDLPADAPPIDISETFSVSVVSEADPLEHFEIPLDETRSWTKQLNLAISRNPNRTLVSFNGTISDQAGPTILAAAQTAIAIGGAVAFPPAAPVLIPADLAAAQHDVSLKMTPAEFSQLNILKGAPQIGNRSAFAAKMNLAGQRLNDFASFLNSAEEHAKERVRPVMTAAPICADALTKPLQEIAAQQSIIQKAQAAAKPKPGSASDPGDKPAASAGATDPTITRAQARIATIVSEYNLTRKFILYWTPTRAELAKFYKDEGAPILDHRFDVYNTAIRPWLSTSKQEPPAKGMTEDIALQQLRRPLDMVLSLQEWSVGRDFSDAPLDVTKSAMDPNTRRRDRQAAVDWSKGTPDGIVYRTPALGRLRACMGTCSLPVDLTGVPVAGRSAGDQGRNQVVEVGDDVMAELAIPVSQYGQFGVARMGSQLFETSVVTLMQNLDGSIATVGAQSSNAAAAGFGAATAAANAQTGALAARNTAAGAYNTATTAQAQEADTINKAIADCYTQQTAITNAGGHPVGRCQ